jgi:NAD(P)H-dependent flavin oxidoreductase YrpB (nitropropane dioxygenase family)
VIEELPGAGTAVWVTVTTPAEATVAERAGADALVGRRCSQRAPTRRPSGPPSCSLRRRAPLRRTALPSGGNAGTALTRAFTGYTARGLVNRFLPEHDVGAPSAYPEVHHLTAPVRAAAREGGDPDGFHLWAGQAYGLAEELPAAELVERLAREAREAMRRMPSL